MQTQQAGLILSEARENSGIHHVAFLRKNYEFKKIRERENEPNFKLAIGLAFAEICAYSGIKGEISDPDKRDILRMILTVYPALTLEEIYKAFELERYGVYEEKSGHFQQFNADYVSNILQKYKKWKQSTVQVHYIERPKSEEKSTITPEEQRELMDKAIIRMYNEFLESGEVSIPCGHVFDELYERKLFPADTDYQKKYSIARFQLEKELKSEKSLNRQERNKIEEAIKSLAEPKNEKALSRAKQLVLKDYFTNLKSLNMSINEILKY